MTAATGGVRNARLDPRALFGFAPFVFVSAVAIAAQLASNDSLFGVLKPVLIPALLLGLALALLTLRQGYRPVTVVLLVVALVLSWVGDVTLGDFVIGLGAFLLAQLAYIALFWVTFRRRLSWWGLLAVPWLVAFVWLLAPGVGALLPAVIVYGAAVGFAAVSATRGNLLTILGGVLFVASDSMLGLRMFTNACQGPIWDAAIMATYLAAEALYVFGVLRGAPRDIRTSTIPVSGSVAS